MFLSKKTHNPNYTFSPNISSPFSSTKKQMDYFSISEPFVKTDLQDETKDGFAEEMSALIFSNESFRDKKKKLQQYHLKKDTKKFLLHLFTSSTQMQQLHDLTFEHVMLLFQILLVSTDQSVADLLLRYLQTYDDFSQNLKEVLFLLKHQKGSLKAYLNNIKFLNEMQQLYPTDHYDTQPQDDHPTESYAKTISSCNKITALL